MLAFSKLVGKPITVDEDSLPRLGPVRTKIWCKARELVHGSIVVYPDDKAYRIKARIEGQAASEEPRVASPSQHGDLRKGRSMEEDSSGPPFSQQAWDDLGPILQQLYLNRAPRGGGQPRTRLLML